MHRLIMKKYGLKLADTTQFLDFLTYYDKLVEDLNKENE